jgi:hypothetical protein
MDRTRPASLALLSLSALLAAGAGACGDDSPDSMDPGDLRFDVTTLVVVVNPVINDGTRVPLPTPGSPRGGITVSDADGPAVTTDDSGIAVLAPMPTGIRTILVAGGGVDGSFDVTIGPGALREVAVAAEGPRVELMTSLEYAPDRIMELSPAVTAAQINDALRVSDRVVFLTGGVYTGDLDLSASRVTLFGQGVLGGKVTLQGNVTLSAKDSRIRGAHITGTLTVPASSTAVSFSRVDGGATVGGTDAIVLQNDLCGGAAITGSGVFALGNRGVAPTATCP